MVGPAFAAGLVAAAATLIPFPAGAYDQWPALVGDFGVTPSVINTSSDFPTVSQYLTEFTRNAMLSGALAASVAHYQQ